MLDHFFVSFWHHFELKMSSFWHQIRSTNQSNNNTEKQLILDAFLGPRGAHAMAGGLRGEWPAVLVKHTFPEKVSFSCRRRVETAKAGVMAALRR